MIRPFILFFILTLIFPFSAICAPLSVQELQTGSGIKVLLIEDHTLPILSVDVIFRDAGFAHDPAGKEGLTYLLSNLLDQGAGKRKAKDFQQVLFDHSISLSFGCSQKFFYGSLETLSIHKKLAFSLLGDAFLSPRFDSDAFDTAVQNQLVEIQKSKESPTTQAELSFRENVYPNSAYGRPLYGRPETLKNLRKKDLKNFKTAAFSKKNILITAVGDITPDELSSLIEKTFGNLPTYPTLTGLSKPRYTALSKPSFIPSSFPQSVIFFGVPTLSRKDPDFPAFLLVNQAFGGGGLSSRLFTTLRKEKGLTYGASTYFRVTPEPLWVGQLSTHPDKVDEALSSLFQSFETLKKGLSKDELSAAKTYLSHQFDAGLLTNSGRLSFLSMLLIHDLPLDYEEDYKNLLNSVSEDDTIRVTKKILDASVSYIVIGGPHGTERTRDIH